MLKLMEHLMPSGAPPINDHRAQQLKALWEIAENSDNGHLQGLLWEMEIERNPQGRMVQIVARYHECIMTIGPGENRPVVCGAVDHFFYSNQQFLEELIKKQQSS